MDVRVGEVVDHDVVDPNDVFGRLEDRDLRDVRARLHILLGDVDRGHSYTVW